ncbi:unnamed protein product, partial [marine sediment metagenome]
MPSLKFKEVDGFLKRLKFREEPLVTGAEPADQPEGLPAVMDLFGAAPDPIAPRPEPGVSFGGQALERAGRIDEATPPVEPP